MQKAGVLILMSVPRLPDIQKNKLITWQMR